TPPRRAGYMIPRPAATMPPTRSTPGRRPSRMNRSPWPFRLQIVLLWVGHLARVLGENCVRFIVLTAPLIELYRRESTPHREGGPDLLTVSYQPVWVVVASALPAL